MTSIWKNYGKKRRDWIVKWDKAQPIYMFYGFKIVQEGSTMRLVGEITD